VYNSCICSPHNPIPPCYTLYKYIELYLFTQGRERGEGEPEKVIEVIFHKRGQKYQ
jgi:hypothetical protein